MADSNREAKCALCESKLGATSFPEIDHYRPKAAYYWLIFDWGNMLLSCRACNTTKGSQFPLMNEADRATGPEDDLEEELPTLINPIADDPQAHIQFSGPFAVGRTERGKRTIEILRLNQRSELFERRREALRFVELKLSCAETKGTRSETQVKLKANTSQYSAMVRSFLRPLDGPRANNR